MFPYKFKVNRSRVLSIAVSAIAVAIFLNFSLFSVQDVSAGHKMKEGDLEVNVDDPNIVDEGRGWYAQRCAFCHGGGARGGKGPCLTCGKFKYTGNTNMELFTTISVGVPRNRGGTMGAFGTTMTPESIMSVIAFLRFEEARRIREGEIEDPYRFKEEPMVFPE